MDTDSIRIRSHLVREARKRIFSLCHKVTDAMLALDNMGDPTLLQYDKALQLLGKHEAGCWCGSAALIFHQHLNQVGCRSAVIDFGFPGTSATHISVVAELGNGIWQLHDPYFNVESLPIESSKTRVRFVVSDEQLTRNRFEQLCLSTFPIYAPYRAKPAKSLSRYYAFAITFTVDEFFLQNPGHAKASSGLSLLNDIFEHPFRGVTNTDFTRIVLSRMS